MHMVEIVAHGIRLHTIVNSQYMSLQMLPSPESLFASCLDARAGVFARTCAHQGLIRFAHVRS